MEEDQEDLNDLMKKHKAAVAQVWVGGGGCLTGGVVQAAKAASSCLQSAQNLAQISDLQAQLEEALKERQEVQEKVGETGPTHAPFTRRSLPPPQHVPRVRRCCVGSASPRRRFKEGERAEEGVEEGEEEKEGDEEEGEELEEREEE